MAATIHKTIIPVITKFKLNICEPYKIKYPIPFLDTKNSPIITPLLPLQGEKIEGYKIPRKERIIWVK